MEEPKEIQNGLKPLFKTAEERGLWFYHNGLCTGEIYFSPEELRAKQAEGKFLWGAVNWTLINPQKIVKDLELKVKDAELELKNILERLNKRGSK